MFEIARDDAAAIGRSIAAGAQHDLLITLGGASVGGFSDGPGVNTLHEQGKLHDMLHKAGAL